jgi:trans-2-enoyl-CoA reductase
MKHIFFHRYGAPSLVAQCVDTAKPSDPSAWEVIVQVEAFPINPADTAMILGQYGFLYQPPTTIGMEAAGRIVEIGKSVKDLSIGDPVIILANNNWSQFRKVPATLVVKVPHEADMNQMSMLKVTGLTAWNLLNAIVTLKPGDTVIQNAPLSSVGQYVIQLANMLGLKTINLVRRPEQISEVVRLGGTLCFTDEEDVAKQVREQIGKTPLRLALDCVGGLSTERLGQCLNEHGTVVNYGMLSMERCVFSPEHLIFRNVDLVGFWLSRILNKMSAADRSHQISQLATWACEGKLTSAIDSIFPIEQIDEALRRSEQSGRLGKVIVHPNMQPLTNPKAP